MAAEQKLAIKIAGELDSSFQSSIAGAKQGIASLTGGGSGKLGSVFSGLGDMAAAAGKVIAGTYAAIGASAAAAGTYAVNTGMDFESAMASAAATAGLQKGTADYQAFEDAAREAGRTTSKTASEAANALEYMALAGWSVNTSTQALTPILQLSEATGLDLARTSDLVTDSMSALGLQVGENGEGLNNYLDVLASAQNNSNQTAEQLMEAYTDVGGVMNGLGVPFQDTATALGVLANRGIKGSEAGTALNALMTNLTTGAGRAGDMLESLGVSAFDDQGRFIGLRETLQRLNAATADMTEEERNAAFAAIGSKTHVDALNDLMQGLNATTEDGANEWNALSEAIYDSNGAMSTMRNVKTDTLAGDLDILKSSIADIGITAYQMDLATPLREAAQWATEAANTLNAAYQADGLPGFTRKIGDVLGDAALITLQNSDAFFNAGTEALNAFSAGISANAGAIGGSIGEIIANGIIFIFDTLPGLTDAGLGILEGILANLEGNQDQIGEAALTCINQIGNAIQVHAPAISSSAIHIVTNLLLGIAQNAPALIVGGAVMIREIAGSISQNLPALLNAGMAAIGGVLLGIIQALPYLVTAGLMIAYTLANYIANNAGQIVTAGMQLLLMLAIGIAQALPMIAAAAVDIIPRIGLAIIQNLPTILAYGARIIAVLAVGIVTAVASLVVQLPAIFGELATAIMSIDWVAVGIDIVKSIWSGVKQLWDDFMDWTMNAGPMGGAEEAAQDIPGWTRTMDGLYTMGEEYAFAGEAPKMAYTAEELAAHNVAGASDVVAYQASQASEQVTPTVTTDYANGEVPMTSTPIASTASDMDFFNNIVSGVTTGSEEMVGQMTSTFGAAGESSYGAFMEGWDWTQMVNNGVDVFQSTAPEFTVPTSDASVSGAESGRAYGEGYLEGLQESYAQISQTPAPSYGPAADSLASTEGLNAQAQTPPLDTTPTVESLTELSTQLLEGGTEGGTNLSTGMEGAISGLPGILQGAGQDAMSQFNSAIQAGANVANSTIHGMVQTMQASVSGLGSGMYSAGQQAMQGLTNGLAAGGAAAVAKAREIAAQVKEAVSGAQGFQNGSPSKYFTESGVFAMQGLAIGFENMRKSVIGIAGNIAGGVKAEMTDLTPAGGLRPLQASGSGGAASMTVTYAPVFNLSGNASRDDMVQAQRISQREFEKMMKEYQRSAGRVAFA